MKAFVFDTSALVRLYVPDGPLPAQVEEAIQLAGRAEAVAFVPELAWAEAAQVLLKKGRSGSLGEAEVQEILQAMLALPIESVGHRELLPKAVDLARRHGLTAYDGLFLALALDRRGQLISADEALQGAFQHESTG